MQGSKVKGALLVPLAMVIRNQKDQDWLANSQLTPQELELIRKGILASVWYDQLLWEKMGYAVWRVIGKGTAEGAYLFGYGIVARTLLNIYASKIVKDDPEKILRRFAEMYQGTFFTSGRAEFHATDKGGIFTVSHSEGIPIQECFVPFLKGFLTKIIEENYGDKVKVECEEETLYKKEKLFTLNYHISWEAKK